MGQPDNFVGGGMTYDHFKQIFQVLVHILAGDIQSFVIAAIPAYIVSSYY